jgi:hypothetical protein
LATLGAAAGLLALLPASAAFAQRSVAPLQTVPRSELPFGQERHQVQLTLGSALARRPNRVSVPLGIEYGVTSAWQVDGELEGAWGDREPGTSAIRGASFGVQRSWAPGAGSRTHLAVGLEGEYDAESSTTQPALKPEAAVAREIGTRGAQAFAHVALRVAREAPAPAVMAGAFVPVGRAFVIAQLSHEAGDDGEPARTELTPGVAVRLAGAELVAGIPIPMPRSARAAGAILKLTVEF